MKWRPENIRESMYPVLVLNWLIGLGLVDYPVGNSRNKFLLVMNLLIASSFWVNQYYFENIPCFLKQKQNLAMKLYRMIRYLALCAASSSIIMGWYYRKRMQLFTQNLERMDEIFEFLGLKKNYYKTFQEILWTVSVFIIIVVLLFIQTSYLRIHMENETKFIKDILCTCIQFWPAVTCIYVDITFGIALQCVERRFKNNNHILRKGFCEYPILSCFNKNEIYDMKDFQFTTNLNSTNFEKSRNVIELLKQIHLELCKLAREINHIFGVHITLHMALVFMTTTVYFFNLITIYLGPPFKSKYILLINFLGYATLYLLKLLFNNIVCSLTSNEANITGEILLDMKLLRKNYTVISEIDRFYQQINLRPLTFTTFGFNTLGVSFIFRFLGTVVTYLLILIQIDQEGASRPA